jgi:hypothetical protein
VAELGSLGRVIVTKTAEQFARELKDNPEYQARLREQQKHADTVRAACAPEDAQLVSEFRDAGVVVPSVWDLVNTAAGYPELYPVLVRHLDIPHHRAIREGIIRALTVRDAKAVAEEALFRHFQSELDPHLRWVLASALKTVMPYHRRKKHPEIAHAFSNYHAA